MSPIDSKDKIAQQLAEAHREMDPAIWRVVRILSDAEDDPSEPLKLLEVNPETVPSGIVPIAFGAHPPDVPYSTVIVEVTDREYAAILNGDLRLHDGWVLGDTLIEAA